ncbi:MAG TPA: M16 family metallopeptidase [Elainellaceae cyanobacterium]
MTVKSSVAHSLQNRTIHRAVLSNGMVVLAVENPAADIVAARILVRCGSRCEAPYQSGISHLLSAVLTKGTDRLSSQEIAERVESVGASLGADSASDYCLMSLKTVAADFPEMLHLASEMLRSPAFPEAEVELERRLALHSIRAMQEQPFTVAYQQLRQILYADHPYALSGLGTEDTVSKLTHDDLFNYHHTHFRPDNMVISIAGRMIPDEAIALIDEVFGNWTPPADWADMPQVNQKTVSSDRLPVESRPERAVILQDTQQAIVMAGYLAASVHGDDYTVLKLLSTYLGNGLSSRLFIELREKRGLAYDVSALYSTRFDTSHFVTYMGTAPSNASIALDGLNHEVRRLCTTPLSSDELQASKNKLLGQYALGKQTNAQLAQLYGWYEILNLGIEFDQTFQHQVASISADQAQDVACCYFMKEPYVSLVGPADAVSHLATPAISQ